MDELKTAPRTASPPPVAAVPPKSPTQPLASPADARVAAASPTSRQTGDLRTVSPAALKAARARTGRLPELPKKAPTAAQPTEQRAGEATPPAATPPEIPPVKRMTGAEVRAAGGVMPGDSDSQGSTNVADTQRRLAELKDENGQPYYKGPIDGKHSPEMDAAIRKFQADQQKKHPQMKVDGIVGPQTQAAMAVAKQEQDAKGPQQPPIATPSDPTTPTPAVSNSEATTMVPFVKNPDGSNKLDAKGNPIVDQAALDKLTVEQRRALLKGLEGGKVYTSDQEDALKAEIGNSLLRTNPEAITPEDVQTLNRGLYGMGQAPGADDPTTGKPWDTNDPAAMQRRANMQQANDHLTRMKPETLKAAVDQNRDFFVKNGGDVEREINAWGRFAGAYIRQQAAANPNDPEAGARAANEMYNEHGTKAYAGHRMAAAVNEMTDAQIQEMARTPAGRAALKILRDNGQGTVWNSSDEQAAVERVKRLVPDL